MRSSRSGRLWTEESEPGGMNRQSDLWFIAGDANRQSDLWFTAGDANRQSDLLFIVGMRR